MLWERFRRGRETEILGGEDIWENKNNLLTNLTVLDCQGRNDGSRGRRAGDKER